MVILGATVAFDYLWKAILVGIAFFALFGERIEAPYRKKNLFLLFGAFAFLGIYELPAILSLDATITVRNKEIAAFFQLEENAHLSELYDIDLFDLVVWLLQATVALAVGERLQRKFHRPSSEAVKG
jgi:hypothetical protein